VVSWDAEPVARGGETSEGHALRTGSLGNVGSSGVTGRAGYSAPSMAFAYDTGDCAATYIHLYCLQE
jgi:hypothetical protein